MRKPTPLRQKSERSQIGPDKNFWAENEPCPVALLKTTETAGRGRVYSKTCIKAYQANGRFGS